MSEEDGWGCEKEVGERLVKVGEVVDVGVYGGEKGRGVERWRGMVERV